jgi:hypothetical protein
MTAPNLIAFVGRRISVEHVEPQDGEIPFDSHFKVRAEVLDVVFGSYAPEEIEFSSYVHIGEPAFGRNEFGLVYVSKYDGGYVHQKYLFQPLFKTNDGRWAGCGDPYGDMPEIHRHGVKAVPISFSPPATFDIAKEKEWHAAGFFSSPYFQIEGNVATCLMGNYPAELFRVMAEGYLDAREVLDPDAIQ